MNVSKLLSVSAVAALSLGLTVCGPALNANAAGTNAAGTKSNTSQTPKTTDTLPNSKANMNVSSGSLQFDNSNQPNTSNSSFNLDTKGANAGNRTANLNSSSINFEDDTGSGLGWNVALSGNITNNADKSRNITNAKLTNINASVSQPRDNQNNAKTPGLGSKQINKEITLGSDNKDGDSSTLYNATSGGDASQTLNISNAQLNVPTGPSSDFGNDNGGSYTANLTWHLSQNKPSHKN